MHLFLSFFLIFIYYIHMRLHKKLTSRLSKVMSCLHPSVDEFEIVTVSRLSQHASYQQSQDSQTTLASPISIASHPLHSQVQPQLQRQQDRRKKRQSAVCPEDELDLLRINGMLIEASKSWKETHHRKKLMAFPSRKFGEHHP